MDFTFRNTISKTVLCNYLSRATTFACSPLSLEKTPYAFQFILDTGAKYICRAAHCWVPSADDYDTYDEQRQFIEQLHAKDPEVVFEACIFENVTKAVETIAIPPYVFEEFGLPYEERCFSLEKLIFPNGLHWELIGKNAGVPDITQTETQMFFYYRACEYIKLGYEALHMGQIEWIGYHDYDRSVYTDLLSRIRTFAQKHARRGFVFLNCHTHGDIGTDGRLLFDFHMFPSRPKAVGTKVHPPTEDNPQRCILEHNHLDSIYGKSLGGLTYSGWECASLPYLVELDNFGNNPAIRNQPNPERIESWGMDEITWFANQPDHYRAEFLRYAYQWMREEAKGDGFFAMPGHRIAEVYNEIGEVVAKQYSACYPQSFSGGTNDQKVIRAIWNHD
ncbi:MAG: hypothetical protein IKU10_00020 [Clostridia bacterium]|nr:hypothetical protein [Clostridia bacterium]